MSISLMEVKVECLDVGALNTQGMALILDLVVWTVVNSINHFLCRVDMTMFGDANCPFQVIKTWSVIATASWMLLQNLECLEKTVTQLNLASSIWQYYFNSSNSSCKCHVSDQSICDWQ